jgi:hypothetical protein
MSGRTNPVFTCCYRESSEVESCAQGLRLVLDFAESKKKDGCGGGGGRTKESENGCDAARIVSR